MVKYQGLTPSDMAICMFPDEEYALPLTQLKALVVFNAVTLPVSSNERIRLLDVPSRAHDVVLDARRQILVSAMLMRAGAR